MEAISAVVSTQETGVNGSTPESAFKSTYKVVYVSITYPDCEPIHFWFKRQMGKHLTEQRKAFVALSEAEQQEQVVAYRTNMLAQLCYDYPQNLPDFPNTGDLVKDFNDYFSQEENQELLAFVWAGYQRNLYPKELSSNLSE